MNKLFLTIAFLFTVNLSFSNNEPFKYTVDITKTNSDKVVVNLIPPSALKGEVIFRFPKIVPGTYSIYDFGRFVENFSLNTPTNVDAGLEKLDVNSWKIKHIELVQSISYHVNDSWDTDDKENFVFEPAGTNIEDGKNFVFNNHGFFGYFDGYTQSPIEITFIKPENFYASTGLDFTQTSKTQDLFKLKSYNDLVDGPIMYNVPDTTFIQVGKCKVLISVYNEKKDIDSKKISSWIKDILFAQKEFLGGNLPVTKYAFIIYIPTEFKMSAGALEHNNSSLYFLPYYGDEYFKEMMEHVAAHEFFHIVTPLTLHSDEIHYFDFANPKMSKHLWLYEGMTEYNSFLVQVQNGIMSEESFYDQINGKIMGASGYNDTVPFTTMSLGCLDKYKSEYGNVYEKGALINMCIDILMIKHSNGTKRWKNIISQLSDKYGASRPFKDNQLFDDIESLTYPEIRKFLNTYVDGNLPLPLAEILEIVGIKYELPTTRKVIDPGFNTFNLAYDQEKDKFYIASSDDITPVGKKTKFMVGDMIKKINGIEVNLANANDVFSAFYKSFNPGDKVNYEVIRVQKGKSKVKKLKGVLGETDMDVDSRVVPIENPSSEQLKYRQFWMAK